MISSWKGIVLSILMISYLEGCAFPFPLLDKPNTNPSLDKPLASLSVQTTATPFPVVIMASPGQPLPQRERIDPTPQPTIKPPENVKPLTPVTIEPPLIQPPLPILETPLPLSQKIVPQPVPIPCTGATSCAPTPTTPPVSTPVPMPTAAPLIQIENVSSSDNTLLQTYFSETEEGSDPTPEENNAILDGLLNGGELGVYDTLELTTDGGPLLFTTDGGPLLFTTQALFISPPKAWQRLDRRQIKERVQVKKTSSLTSNVLMVKEITGTFLIDRDGTQANPSPGLKPIAEKLIRRFSMKKQDNQWHLSAVSHATVLPVQPDPLILPKIQEVKVFSDGQLLHSLSKPLQLVSKETLPALTKGKTIRIEATVSSQDLQFLPPAYVYLHAGGQRWTMKDNGQEGDRIFADGIFTAILQVPISIKPVLHLGIDTIAARTMKDETIPNYQSLSWMLAFRSLP